MKSGLTFDIVLEGCSGDQDLGGRREHAKSFVQLTLGILQPVSLVDHQDLPLDLSQILSIAQSEFIGCKQNIHLQFLEWLPKFVCPYVLPCESVSDVGDNVDVWCPTCKLCLPGGDCGERDDDKERAILVPAVKQVRQECHRLHSL